MTSASIMLVVALLACVLAPTALDIDKEAASGATYCGVNIGGFDADYKDGTLTFFPCSSNMVPEPNIKERDDDENHPWNAVKDEVTSIVINGNNSCIGYSAFDGYNETSLVITGVKQIGANAFYNNLNLETITLPGSLERLEEKTFGVNYDLGRGTVKSVSFGPAKNLEMEMGTFYTNSYAQECSITFDEGITFKQNDSDIYGFGMRFGSDTQFWIKEGDTSFITSGDDVAGYTFTSTDGGKNFYRQGSTSFTVAFNPNGGAWSDGSVSKTVTVADGGKLDLSGIELPTKESYVFDKWVSTDGEQTHGPHDEFEVHADMDFIATWKEPTQGFTVTFDPNGGSWPWSDPFIVKCESGGTIELDEIGSPTRESYTFGGWNCDGTTYSSDAIVTVSSDMTFKALWYGGGSSSGIIPLFPGDEQDAIEIITDDGKDGSGDKEKTVLIIGIIVAIIAILAAMSITKKE